MKDSYGNYKMTTVNPTINDTLTQVQLRQIRQKLNEERQMRTGRETSSPRAYPDDQHVKLQEAMQKRQELLDRLRQEKNLRDELQQRPASYSARRSKRKTSPQTPRRAESLPPPVVNQGQPTPRQVVEHQIRPIRLDPIVQTPPAPQIIQTAPMAAPYMVPTQPVSSKGEMMEMMMLQNAQMHQMIMNQMMMQSIPRQQPDTRANSRVDIDDLINRRRPPSVHHHHYDQSRQTQQPLYTLPPVQAPPMGYPSPRYYPAEMEPLQQPRVRKKTPPPVTVPAKPPKKVYGSLPFPGPWPLRRFRHAAYAVFFEKVLLKLLRKKRKNFFPETAKRVLSPDFMFSIRLKEAVAAVHAVYLNSSNKVSSVFRQFTADNSRDLVASFNSSNKADKDNAIADISYIIENISYEMTDIMPASGVLGTHSKAVTVDMCKNGKLYPKGYLWQIEKKLVELDSSERTRNVTDFQCFMFIVGLFLTRGMVTTLLIKPMEYALTTQEPGAKAKKNLKLIASILVYIYRQCLVPPKSEPQEMPYEISRFLFSDAEMKEVYQKISTSLEYADNLIRKWGKEYVARIQNVLATLGPGTS